MAWFDDNIVMLADSVEDLQTLVTNIHTVSGKFGLKNQQGGGPNDYQRKQACVTSVYIDEEKLKQVKTLHLSRGIITEKSIGTDDIKRRIGLAMGGMQSYAETDFNLEVKKYHDKNESIGC